MFSICNAAEIARVRRDPRANVLVSNVFGEPVRWVELEGTVTIDEEHGCFRTAIALLATSMTSVHRPVAKRATCFNQWDCCWSS